MNRRPKINAIIERVKADIVFDSGLTPNKPTAETYRKLDEVLSALDDGIFDALAVDGAGRLETSEIVLIWKNKAGKDVLTIFLANTAVAFGYSPAKMKGALNLKETVSEALNDARFQDSIKDYLQKLHAD